MAGVKKAILAGSSLREDERLSSHADWADGIVRKYAHIDASNIDSILQDEIGLVFRRVLEDAGVFKRTPEGQKAFDRFTASL